MSGYVYTNVDISLSLLVFENKFTILIARMKRHILRFFQTQMIAFST